MVITGGWLDKTMKRNSSLCFRNGSPAGVLMNVVNNKNTNNYFGLLRMYFKLFDNLEAIYNKAPSPKVAAQKE